MFPRIALLAVLLLQSAAALASEYRTTVFPLERDGVRLHLRRVDEDETPDGKQRLLLHGLTYSSHEFDMEKNTYKQFRKTVLDFLLDEEL